MEERQLASLSRFDTGSFSDAEAREDEVEESFPANWTSQGLKGRQRVPKIRRSALAASRGGGFPGPFERFARPPQLDFLMRADEVERLGATGGAPRRGVWAAAGRAEDAGPKFIKAPGLMG